MREARLTVSPPNEGASNRHSLLLPVGQLVRPVVLAVAQPHQVGQFVHPRRIVLDALAVNQQRQGDVLSDAQRG
jgi:hypothetical protein